MKMQQIQRHNRNYRFPVAPDILAVICCAQQHYPRSDGNLSRTISQRGLFWGHIGWHDFQDDRAPMVLALNVVAPIATIVLFQVFPGVPSGRWERVFVRVSGVAVVSGVPMRSH